MASEEEAGRIRSQLLSAEGLEEESERCDGVDDDGGEDDLIDVEINSVASITPDEPYPDPIQKFSLPDSFVVPSWLSRTFQADCEASGNGKSWKKGWILLFDVFLYVFFEGGTYDAYECEGCIIDRSPKCSKGGECTVALHTLRHGVLFVNVDTKEEKMSLLRILLGMCGPPVTSKMLSSMANLRPAEWVGILRKQGGFRKNWLRRHFVAYHARLFYFENDNARLPARGVVTIRGRKILSDRKRSRIALIGPPGTRDYRLQCESSSQFNSLCNFLLSAQKRLISSGYGKAKHESSANAQRREAAGASASATHENVAKLDVYTQTEVPELVECGIQTDE